jgi:hypothetical protein
MLRNVWNRACATDTVRAFIVMNDDGLTVRIVDVVQERSERERHAAADDQQRDEGGNAGVPKKPEHRRRE